jgi:hypothetical protein
MVDLLNSIVPFMPGIIAAAFVGANIRANAKHNQALREIRASLEETERRLKALGWTRQDRASEEGK